MSDRVDGELTDFLAAWGQAIVANDAAAIGRFASPDWVLVTREAGPVERDRFLDAVAAGDLKHDSFEVDVMNVRSFGESAVVTSHVRNNGRFKGEPFEADEWSTNVLVMTDQGWICVATALTPVSSAA